MQETKELTIKDVLTDIVNTWKKHCVARTIDVATDEALKALDPKMTVIEKVTPVQDVEIPVAQRLENRKINLEDGLRILNAARKLLQEYTSEEEFEKTKWSAEALKVADDFKGEQVDGNNENKPEEPLEPGLKTV